MLSGGTIAQAQANKVFRATLGRVPVCCDRVTVSRHRIHGIQELLFMPDISPIGHGQTGPNAAGSKGPVHRSTSPSLNASGQPAEVRAEQAAGRSDRLELSPQAGRIKAIRAAIAAGSYETDEKMSAAVERLLRDVRGD
jgi:anti-sigma28 factor (negative regulator of flagellin synthesis)